MRRILFLLLLLPFVTKSQVINPVPDMVFKGQLSAGRTTGTDSSAYMSIGPARGANKGFMAPMVSDTNAVFQPRRDGLLIFSLQRRNFMYWDSLSVRWREFGGAASVDTLNISTRAWRQKGVDSVISLPRVTAVFSGLGMKFDTIKTSGSVSVDTVVMATRVRVQKAVDSLGSAKENKLTLTTVGTSGPATFAAGVLNIPNYSPGSGFIRNLAPISSVPNANGMSKFGDTIRLQPASVNFGGVVTTGNQTFAGEKIFNERIRVGVSGGATIQNTNQFSVGIGNNSLSSSLTTVSNNTAVGYNSGNTNVAGLNNVFLGSQAGSLISTGQNNTNSINGVFVGVDSRPLGDNQTNQIVIGQGSRGNGTNTTTIGNSSTTKTYLKGILNVGTIDSLAPTSSLLFANGNDVVRSGVVPVSAIDTSTIGTKAWRQKGVDSLSSVKQDKLTLTTTGSSGASTLVGGALNVPNYTLAGLGGVPNNRFLTINGVSYDLTADRTWTTVSSVNPGYGMNFSNITSTGSVSADTIILTTNARVKKVSDSLSSLISGGGLGTVTSVSAGFGTNFSTITNTGSVVVDSAAMATRARVQKAIDSINNVNASGTGISGYMTRWTGAKTMDTSQIFQLGRKIGIGTATPTTYNSVSNGIHIASSSTHGEVKITNSTTGNNAGNGLLLGQYDNDAVIWNASSGDMVLATSNIGRLKISAGGNVGIYVNTPTEKLDVDGRIRVRTIDSASSPINMLWSDNNGVIRKTAVPTASLSGGLNGYMTRWSGTNTIDTSQIFQQGANIGIGTTTPKVTLDLGSSTSDKFYLYSSGDLRHGFGIYTNEFRQFAINGAKMTFGHSTGTQASLGFTQLMELSGNGNLLVGTGTDDGQRLQVAGRARITTIDSTTTAVNMLYQDVNGVIKKAAVPSGGSVDSLVYSTRSWRQKGIDSVVNLISNSGGGTVLSVSSGTGMNFPTITSSGSVSADTVILATRARAQKAVDSLSSVKQNNISLTTTGNSGASTFSSSVLNIPNYTLAGLGGVPTSRTLTINGTALDLSADRSWTISGGSGTVTSVAAGAGMNFSTITTTGTVSADTVALSTRAWRQKGIDSVVNLIANSGGGTVLSVSAGTGMNFSTITTTGSVAADTNVLATRARVQKPVDSLGAIKQNNISLTTTGSSGASTFSSNVLNVPNYTIAGLGGVPTSRNITINGATYDLSADRTWTISAGTGTVTSVAAGTGMNFSTITSTGTVTADTLLLSTRPWRQKGLDSLSALKQNNISLTTTGNSGAATFSSPTLNIPNYTLSGLGGVPTSRTLTINGTTFDLSSDRSWTISAGTGTVTSVTGGFGLTGGTITTSGTLALDTSAMATRARVQKGIDSVASLPRITGTGVSGYITRWTGASTQDTSRLFQSGNLIGINTTSPSERLDVDGKIRARVIDSSNTPSNYLWSDATGVIRKAPAVSLTTTGSSGASTLSAGVLNVPNYTLSGLGGVPTSRTLTINGTQFDLSADRSWTISAGSGTVTSVGTGYGLTGGTITTTGTVVADTNQLSSKAWRQKAVDTINATRVPNGRTLTINGTSFDLSANRTWTIASADMDSTSMTAASGWAFCRDISWDDQINELVKTNKNNTIQTITLQGAVYKTTATFTTGAWVTVASIPTGWEPDNVVYGSMSNYVDGADYEHANGTAFSGNAYYEGACVFRINTNGNVQVRADVVTNSATLSGSDYVIFPIHIVYIIKYIPT